MSRGLRRMSLLSLAIVCLACSTAVSARRGLTQERELKCDGGWEQGGLSPHCEVKELSLPAGGGTLSIDGRQNGGVTVKGWDRPEVLVRAKIQTAAPSEGEAASLANQIQIGTGGATIRAEGPEQSEERRWSVSYEVFVPRSTDLSLNTHNGGISVADVIGSIRFAARNGGVSLKGLGGSVKGETVNGGLSVSLAGERWEGEGLDVRTTNGGVSVTVPQNYSARLESSTVHGRVNVNLPQLSPKKVGREFSAQLGTGGALVRAVTTNGGVSINGR